MSDFDHLLDPSAEELDAEIAAAGAILEKLAQEEGVDLESLPEGEVATLLAEMVPSLAQHEPITKEANMTDQITTQDVHFELTKVAADMDVDLTKLSRDEYNEAFEAMLEEMQSPDWEEKVAAEEEARAKIAEAEFIGQAMGDAFLAKLAEHGIVEFGGEPGEGEGHNKEASKTRAAWEAVKAKVRGAGRAIADKERDVSTRVGYKLRGGHEGAKQRIAAGKSALTDAEKSRQVGRMVLGGAGGTLAVGGTAAALGGRKKQSLDEAFESDAVAFANSLLVEHEKVAAEEALVEFSDFAKVAGDEYFQALEERAVELLAENGWL